MDSIRRRFRDRTKNSKTQSTDPTCTVCGNPKSWKRDTIGFNTENLELLCDRCKFLHDVVKECVALGLLGCSGTKQEIRWDEHKDRYRSGNAWCKFDWTIWSNSIGHTGSQFELFALPGVSKPFSDFPEKDLAENTGSPKSVKKVQEWLDVCQRTHKRCMLQSSEPPKLPKRVIDISSSQVRLHETDNEFENYVCLSHCWGPIKPSCRTTSETYASNQICIGWDTLPTTFRDAIDFTRRLGFRYIWIDSVCIIQDNLTDWAEQSATMASIYENAYVTLCATASLNDHFGCYYDVPSCWREEKLQVAKRDGKKYEVYIRFDLEKQHVPAWHDALGGRNATRFPLMARAWTYQERLLSRRLVHFMKGEIMWECSELSDCQCTQGDMEKRSPFMQYHSSKAYHRQAIQSTDRKTVEKYWNDIIFAYSGLHLTLDKDKLPALSGVAKQMLSIRPGDEYLAGLWKKTILSDLRWCLWGENSKRPAKYRSPSWSWASIDGIFNIEYYDANSKSAINDHANCVDVSITPAGADSTGEVSSGYLVLDAPTQIATLKDNPDSRGSWDKWSLEAGSLAVNFKPDCKADFAVGSLKIGEKLLCLRLGESQGSSDMCLVLKQRGVEGATPLYQRVGCVKHKREELEKNWFNLGKENIQVKII